VKKNIVLNSDYKFFYNLLYCFSTATCCSGCTKTDRYILGPPIKSVNESTEENTIRNPSFELAQWYYGLKVAQDWRERMDMKRDPHWGDIRF